ncbi:CDP-diacylglycerol--inositol 3-phosphatidyltransferase [Clonorchis sinensis]|uniref:CDP-diacylglycerol--inositol 3-phosphatidyltransferase n=1 Tax=Clonorchis sinensis TaxID=79923 RepID=G7YA80_CLOSI|nr:CDP-diacylglycerol--inositol 3-phosphatidyltransferase [Clonorchis sinensis]
MPCMQLLECLPDGTVSDINGHWEKISKALLKVGTSVCGTTQSTSFKHWISDRTVSLLETRRQIPLGRHHNSTRRIIRRQVKLSVRADREAWWTRKAEEMEYAKNAGNVRKLFHLIRSTGPRKPLVSEIIRDQNGSLICNKAERMDRWAQYFEEQFSWPPATSNPETWPSTERWTVNMEPPSVSEVSECISLLKRHRYGRIILLLYSCWHMRTDCWLTVFAYVVSGLLDAVDGYAARALNQSSRFGAMLDMLVDRCATMCLLACLATFYPNYVFLFQISMLVDIASHWLHLHTSVAVGRQTHKAIDLSGNPVLRLYYRNKSPELPLTCIVWLHITIDSTPSVSNTDASPPQ